MVLIGEESSKRRINGYTPKYVSMAYYIIFLCIPGRDGTPSKENVLVNALHAFNRFNRRYHVNKTKTQTPQKSLCRHRYASWQPQSYIARS